MLEQAVNFGYPEIVEWLIAAGADPTLANSEGKTARAIAAERDASPRIRAALGMPE